MKHITSAFAIFILSALTAMAQPQIHGNVGVEAGVGRSNPWETSLNLNIKDQKYDLSVSAGVVGLSPWTSASMENLDYTYLSTGNHYTSAFNTRKSGTEEFLKSKFNYRLTANDQLSLSLDATHSRMDIRGNRMEMVTTGGGLKSMVQTSMLMPSLTESEIKAGGEYVHRFSVPMHSMRVMYNYSLSRGDEDELISVENSLGFKDFTENRIKGQNYDRKQSAGVEYDFDQTKNDTRQHAAAGVRYDNRQIHAHNWQWMEYFPLDGDGNPLNTLAKSEMEETFQHDTHVGAVYGLYNVKYKILDASARLEYDYTDLNGKHLNDIVANVRAQLNLRNGNSLTGMYVRNIVRPGLSYLNPAHIKRAFTEDYGNEDLEGVHINNLSLSYDKKWKKGSLGIRAYHIFVDDGFNAIWLEKNDKRISFWGNEGVRRAYGLKPTFTYRPAEGSTISGGAEVLWDKRVADAIHATKKHLGVSANIAYDQRFAKYYTLNAHFDYSKGNTVDLYSHLGQMMRYGMKLERTFLNDKLLTGVSFDIYDDPEIILTQVSYTGSVLRSACRDFDVRLNLGYRF